MFNEDFRQFFDDEDFFRRLFDLNKPTPVIIRIPSDSDIDKVKDTSIEELSYRRIRSIANANVEDVNWAIAIRCLSEDVCIIYNFIKHKGLKHPEELKEFIENCCAIYEHWDNVYREAFTSIKDYHHNQKIEKSIDDMDADELREYIRKRNIK